jgi:ubiquinone/menaquinone biosynthesis C-methylase UbiE
LPACAPAKPPSNVIDYTAIAELPGAPLNAEQFTRFAHRYRLGAQWARTRRVLEVACGAGSGLGYLARHARSIIGLDYSAPVLQRARGHYGAAMPLVRGDARALPFGDAAFDLVLCFEAIYYLGDYRAFLAESARVLAPGGDLLLCQSNPDWPDFVPGDLSAHYPSATELAAGLSQAGFRTVELSGILPTQTGRSALYRLRRLALRSGLFPQRGPLARLLKRVAYGRLIPLPAALTPSAVEAAASAVALTSLALDQPDYIHRVLYAHAVK